MVHGFQFASSVGSPKLVTLDSSVADIGILEEHAWHDEVRRSEQKFDKVFGGSSIVDLKMWWMTWIPWMMWG